MRYKDFDTVAELLHETLHEMSVELDINDLKQAAVTTIHYAKNIVLTNGATPFHYIQKIKQSNIAPHLDTNQTDYKNSGFSFKWHCNGYEIIFYDKLYEVAQTKAGKDFVKQIRSKKKMFELLRMEVRLNNRRKIKKLFQTLHIKSDLTLKSLFKPAIMRKALLHYINTAEQKRLPLLDFKASTNKSLLSQLIINNPKLRLKQILQYVGFKKTTEEMTIDELKNLFSPQQLRSWSRLIAEIGQINLSQATTNSFDVIKKQIKKYQALTAQTLNSKQFLKKHTKSTTL